MPDGKNALTPHFKTNTDVFVRQSPLIEKKLNAGGYRARAATSDRFGSKTTKAQERKTGIIILRPFHKFTSFLSHEEIRARYGGAYCARGHYGGHALWIAGLIHGIYWTAPFFIDLEANARETGVKISEPTKFEDMLQNAAQVTRHK